MKLARLPLGVALALATAATANTALAQSEKDAPPAAPTGLFANAYSGTAAGVAWMPAVDDIGIVAYEVTLDGEVVQESGARSYVDFELTPATAYNVGVTAIDTAGQRSETAFIEFATDGGEVSSGPASVEGLRASVYSPTALGLVWTRPGTFLLRYEVSRDGEVVGETNGVTFIDTGLTPGDYVYEVVAIDRDGARSEPTSLDVSTVEGMASVTEGEGEGEEDPAAPEETPPEGEGEGMPGEEDPAAPEEMQPEGEGEGMPGEEDPAVPEEMQPEGEGEGMPGEEDPAAPEEMQPEGEGMPGEKEPAMPGEGPDEGTPPTETVEDTSTPTGSSILDIARGTDEDGDGTLEGGAEGLGTLVGALGAYPELVNLLDDETAELTVFAPTDDAFAAVDLAALSEADIENVLRYHVVVGTAFNTMALDADATFPMTLETAQGSSVEIVEDGDGSLSLIDADGNEIGLDTVVDAASNGVVYVVDTVLAAPPLPDDEMGGNEGASDPAPPVVDEPTAPEPAEPPVDESETPTMPEPEAPPVDEPTEPSDEPTAGGGGTILDIAAEADGFDSLVAVVGGYPDLVELLGDETAELVVFAPTDDAFAAADLGGLDEAGVRNVLEYHVVTGSRFNLSASGAGATASTTLRTAQGGTLDVVADGTGGLTVIDADGNSVPVEATVDTASNGVVLVIGSVLAAPPATP